jgi:hypothetical protein
MILDRWEERSSPLAFDREAWKLAVPELIRAAALAPSGDNTQPWSFLVSERDAVIEIAVDPDRDTSPMNAGQRMARIAVGAAAENLVQTAIASGCSETKVRGVEKDRLLIDLVHCPRLPVVVPDEILRRCTNRRKFSDPKMPDSDLEPLAASIADDDSLHLRVIQKSAERDAVAKVIASCDRLMFESGAMRRAFLENIRFDRPPRERVEEGLSVASLELGSFDRALLPLVGKLPDWLFRGAGVSRAFEQKSLDLLKNDSAIIVGFAENESLAIDFCVGRLMERVWLELTRRRLAVQPMMSPCVLDGALRYGLQDPLTAGKSAALIRHLLEAAGAEQSWRPAFILRAGLAEPPAGQTGRLASSVQVLSR